MTDPTCLNCRYWTPYGDQGEGTCRRHPPVLDPIYTVQQLLNGKPDANTQSSATWIMPLTDESDWCGEWSATADAGVEG